jgi:DNA-binding SARP family transcriptional activator
MMPRRRVRNPDAFWDWVLTPAFLLALPIALWKLTGNPIPGRLPSWLEVQDWWAGVQSYPAQAFDILPRLLVDAMWIGWAWYAAWFAFGLLWELLRLPGVIMPRILLRLTPRTTVQAITVGAVAAAPAVHAAPAPAHAAANAAPLPADLNGRLHLTAVPAKAATARPAYPLNVLDHPALRNAPVHQVVAGDTLWDLAVRYYGDGEQWKRIFAGNIGLLQPDGRTLTNPDLILPGWTLTIPHLHTPAPGTTATPHPPSPNAATTPATAQPPDGTRTPAPTAPGSAVDRPTDPVAHPGRTPDRPGATTPGDGRPARIPAPDPRVPHAVGWQLPDGDYIGITLIAAVAVSAALLKTRRRLHPDTTPPIPPGTEQVAAVYDAAKAARTPDRTPPLVQGQVPPLFKPQPGVPMLGTYPRAHDEAWYDPGLRSGPLAFDGPGAEDAVRALAVSLLGATDLELDLEPDISPLGLQVVLIDQQLARELFGAAEEQHLPGWLHLTDTPAAAVAAFHAAARQRAEAGIDAEEFWVSDEEPYTALIARTDPALHRAIVEACVSDPTASLGAILLGPAPPGPNTTQVTVGQDGSVTTVTGPRAGEVRGLRLYHLHRDRARELFHLLFAAREVYYQPTPEPGRPAATGTTAPRGGSTAQPDTATEPGAAPQPESDTALQDAAPTAPAQPTPVDPRTLSGTPLLLRVLGPIDILGPDTTQPVRGERSRTILAALALHPHGLRTPQLADLTFDERFRDDRTQKQTVYSAVRRVRELLRTAAGHPASSERDPNEYVTVDPADRYLLDSDRISTDIELRTRLEDQADHTDDPTERLRLLTQAVALHRGPLADGVDDDQRDWLTTARYHELQHAAHLHLRIADLATDNDPATVLDHIKQAAALAPDDEHTITEAIRLYQQLGRTDLARALIRRRAE